MPVDFTGTWTNQHGSTLELHVEDGVLSGEFESGVGSDGQKVRVPVSGQVLDDVITFNAAYPDYGIVVAWVGQHTVEEGVGRILTHWIHATNFPDPEEKEWMWFSNRIGSDVFLRL
jgi:hypothetical protein